MKEDLSAARIEDELTARGIAYGRPLHLVTLTHSTNDDAKQAARGGIASGASFVADAQTEGRGRLGRTWFSPPGENLYASFVVRPCLDVKRAPLITLAAGLAVVDAVVELSGDLGLSLKWPNDVLLRGRKMAGILCEAHLADGDLGWMVVGIGINVHTLSFPEELAERATSLALAGAPSVDRSRLFVAVCAALGLRIEALRTGGDVVADVRAKDALLGRAITVDGVAATALGIAPSGGLRVKLHDGLETICMAGDVQLGLPDQSPDGASGGGGG